MRLSSLPNAGLLFVVSQNHSVPRHPRRRRTWVSVAQVAHGCRGAPLCCLRDRHPQALTTRSHLLHSPNGPTTGLEMRDFRKQYSQTIQRPMDVHWARVSFEPGWVVFDNTCHGSERLARHLSSPCRCLRKKSGGRPSLLSPNWASFWQGTGNHGSSTFSERAE